MFTITPTKTSAEPFLNSPVPDKGAGRLPARREPGNDFPAGGYEREVVDRVWEFAEVVEGNDPALWRKDEFGAWLNRQDYGNRRSAFGWEICDTSHIRRDVGITALRPVQWENLLDQSSAYTESRMTADGLRNTRKLV